MLFHSPRYSALVVNIRSPIEIPHPTLPKIIGEVTPLVADFAQHGGEYDYVTPDGEQIRVADIRGHYFDSVVAQEQNGWTDDERIEVEEGLAKLSKQRPTLLYAVTPPKADLPWPTYGDVPREDRAELAINLGLVEQALAWERENTNYKTVVSKLEAHLFKANADADAEGALSAV
jgi:hypothetical protein